MSVTLYVINKDNDQLIVISDRRTSSFKGQHVTYKHDNAIKHHIINDKLILSPGSTECKDSRPDLRLATVLDFAHCSTEVIKNVVAGFDRRFRHRNGHIEHDAVVLAGLSDDNKFFVLAGQPDGRFTLATEHPETGAYTLVIASNGDHIQPLIGKFIYKRLYERHDTLLQALKHTIKFVSTIDPLVGETYHYTIIKKK
jgi:hypothetical protein